MTQAKSAAAIIPETDRLVQIPYRLLQRLNWATQRQASCQRVVNPKPSQADVDHANEWVLGSVEDILDQARSQGIHC
jgi:hypothetical protein